MASTDLQIKRTQSTRLISSSEALASSVGASNVNPVDVISGALKRQWLRLAAATFVSVAVAGVIATNFSSQKVTARLTLSSRPLPATSQNAYTAPNPSAAAVMLKSARILQPVADRHHLPPVNVLARLMNPFPNPTTGSIEVALVQSETDKAIAVLNDAAAELVNSIAQDRKETLSEHAGYIRKLLVTAKKDLGDGRMELARLEESLRLNGADSTQKHAAFFNLANREGTVKSSIEDCRRRVMRLQGDLKLLSDEFAAVRNAAFRAVIDGRRRQSERLGQRLTRTAPASTVNAEIQRQLQEAEQELADRSKETAGPSPNDRQQSVGVPEEGRSAGNTRSQNATSRIVEAGKAVTVGAGSSDLWANVEASELVADQLTKWVERISAIGRDTLGELDSATLESARTSFNRLSKISDEVRQLQFEANNNKVDLDYYLSSIGEFGSEKSRTTNEEVRRSSNELMELELEVDEKEKQYSQLSQQLVQINQLKDCELTEYVVTSSAAVNAVDDVSSNRRNLFVCSFLAFGALLTAPVIVMEVMRLRPSPVDVISRRWNLPVLGSYASGGSRVNHTLENVGSQDLRLMALRIQQSLCRPAGRVVLFAGLDHKESPLSLIRSLSFCLAQREESVLMIQIPATCSATETSGSPLEPSFKVPRPGVAEYLAGNTEDASALVFTSGVNGVDCLSGGCSAVASEAMASSRLTGLIEQFRAKYSMIILSGPSTLSSADLQMLAARADGIVFTVNQSSVSSVDGNEVIGDLLELGAPILGLAEQPQITGHVASAIENQNVANLSVR